VLVVALVTTCGSVCAFAQIKSETPGASKSAMSQLSHVQVGGYLAGREPDFLDILPPYPNFGSIQDQADVTTLRQWQQPGDSARWQLANEDVKMSYDRFAQTFGTKISQANTPLLVQLLDRVEQDVQTVAFSAKGFYNRPRPFQRFQMEHVCGAEKAPAAEASPKGGSSYPSGHTSFGWAAVLVLAEVAPERAPELLARGREYGESRIVCAVHYPSDVVAGELIAATVVARLHADKEFSADLNCAEQEHALRKSSAQLSKACQIREGELRQQ